MKDVLNCNYSNKNFNPLGPYSNIFNGGGGFCRKIGNNHKKNIYQYQNIDIFDKYNNHCPNNISRNNGQNNNNNSILKYPHISYNNNFIMDHNSMERYNHSQNRFILKNNEKMKKNKNNHKKKKLDKVNINEVFKNIIYLKLNIENINDDSNLKQKEKEEINNENNNEINLINKDNKNINNNKNNDFKESPSKTIPNDKMIKNDSYRTLIKQSNENFSMKNDNIKKFNKLYEVDSVLLNYLPSFNIQRNDINTKPSLTNFSISSNQIEYNIINEPKVKNLKEDNKELIKSVNNKTIPSFELNIPINNNNNMNLNNEYSIFNNNDKKILKENKLINIEKNINLIDDKIKSKVNDKSDLDKKIIFNNINYNYADNNNINDINKINDDNMNIYNNKNNNNNYINNNINNIDNNKDNNNINNNIEKKDNINNNSNNMKINENSNNSNIYNNFNNININSYNIKENDSKNKTQNNECKEEEKDLKHKNSKQFMKFRSKIMQNSENELKKIGI